MNRMMMRVVVLCCAITTVGCGEDGITLTNIATNAIAADCAYLFRCEDVDGELRAAYGTEGACQAALRGEYPNDIRGVQPFVDRGTVRFNATNAERCLDLLSTTCSFAPEATDACEGIWEGLVPTYGSCTDDLECASGYCSGDETMCGVCEAPIPLGQVCALFGIPCAASPDGPVRCRRADTGTNYYCTLLDPFEGDVAAGDDCTGLDGRRCGPGLFCNSGICSTRRPAGDACDPYADACVTGTVCHRDTETCVEVRVESTPGAPCGMRTGEFAACDATAGLHCDPFAEVCARGTQDQTQGGYCDRSTDCADGLVCLYGVCVGDPLPDGSECEENIECASVRCERDTVSGTYSCVPQLTCS